MISVRKGRTLVLLASFACGCSESVDHATDALDAASQQSDAARGKGGGGTGGTSSTDAGASGGAPVLEAGTDGSGGSQTDGEAGPDPKVDACPLNPKWGNDAACWWTPLTGFYRDEGGRSLWEECGGISVDGDSYGIYEVGADYFIVTSGLPCRWGRFQWIKGKDADAGSADAEAGATEDGGSRDGQAPGLGWDWIYLCQTADGMASKDEAAATSANPGDLETGCRGAPWQKWTYLGWE